MRPRHAFTAIELLVVIVIIFTVFVLLDGPFFQPSREKARRARCKQNLLTIGLACAQYAQDYAGRLPGGTLSVFSNVLLTSKSIGDAYILTCPSSAKRPLHDFHSNITDAANVSYTQQAGTTTGMIWQANAGEVLFWDQGVAGNACGPNGGVGLSWAATSNHKGAGGNVLFNDGHAAWQTKTPTNMPLGCLNP